MVTALIPSDRLLEQSSGIKQLTTVLVIVCMIIALALGLFLSSQMTGTIKYILRQLRKVSNGNLTVHLSAKHKDEFGYFLGFPNQEVKQALYEVVLPSLTMKSESDIISHAKLPRAKPNSNKEVNFLMRCQFGVFEKYKNVCLCRAGRDQ